MNTLDFDGLYRPRSIGSSTVYEMVGPMRDPDGHPLRVKDHPMALRFVMWRERNRGRPVTQASMTDLWTLIDEAERFAGVSR